MKEALYYVRQSDMIECRLCPHYCRIPENRTGFCGVRQNIGNKLYTQNYGRVTAMHMDPVEKKPLFHFMPGTYTLSVGSFGCNLDCPFCQNSDISKGSPAAHTMTPRDIVDMAFLEKAPSISYTYSEPGMFYEFMLDTAVLAREAGLKNIMVTNGYINREPMEALLPYLDAMNIDLKTFDADAYKKVLKGGLGPVLDTIRLSAKSCHVEVTMLVVPKVSDDISGISMAAKELASVSPDMPLHLSRYFPRYKYTEPPTDLTLLKNAYSECSKYLKHVYLGNV